MYLLLFETIEKTLRQIKKKKTLHNGYSVQTWMKSNIVRGKKSSKIAISLENLLIIPPVIQIKIFKEAITFKRTPMYFIFNLIYSKSLE